MQIKHVVAAFGLVVVAAASLAVSSTRANASVKGMDGAFIDKDFNCGMFDGDGGFLITGDSHVVVNDNNTNFKCSAKGVANSTGKAVVFEGFGCRTQGGFTTDSREVISASGNATLTCKVH